MSLLDFDPTIQSPPNPSIEGVDFAETHLVGLGAIGNGCIWTLSRMRDLRGTLHLVDDQITELSNLQRYVLAVDLSIGHPKVAVARERLADTGLNVMPHHCQWGIYLAERNDWEFRRVAVAVDTAGDRQAIQASLPEWIVNAWTQIGDLGISRHTFLGDQACLACLYLPTSPQKNEDELVAEAIGLPQEKLAVRRMLVTNEPLDHGYLAKIAEATNVDPNQLVQFEGQPLRLFYVQAVCGGVLLRLGATPATQRRIEGANGFSIRARWNFFGRRASCESCRSKTMSSSRYDKAGLVTPSGPILIFARTKKGGWELYLSRSGLHRCIQTEVSPMIINVLQASNLMHTKTKEGLV